MRKQLRIKLKSKRGFTLSETLLAVLILLMVSEIVASGIPSARNAYEKVVLASNAEVLLSTTASTLRNELGTAQNVETPTAEDGERKDTVITYFNPTRGAPSKLYVGKTGINNKKIMLQRYDGAQGMSAEYPAAPLISSETATGDLYVSYGEVAYTDGMITFTDLTVHHTSDTTCLAAMDKLSVRVISDHDD